VADYLPKFKPGTAITRNVSAAVTGGQLVSVSGTGTVAPSAAGDTGWLGVASRDALTVGQQTGVHCGGVQRLTASAAIAAGVLVKTAANGQIATWVVGTDAYQLAVGLSLEAAAGAASVISVKMTR
jgi:hypothetical protein